MKTIILLPLLLAAATSSAQDTKGATPLPTQNSKLETQNSTRAVVIGISDYQDPAIPDLQFAHLDAEAFAEWLRSPAGGSVPEANIRLLLNGQATIGNMYKELEWLVEQSREGDRAVIYFSGHGDIEAKTRKKEGFLLCYNSPPNNYRTNAFAVYFLQDIIERLSLDQKAQVLVVTDACRAGKLAGSEYGGAQLTAAALQERFTNEVKILSCQPNEYSIESAQWGGGRGVFSYHLVDALYGLADRDADERINLKEVGRYLEDRVPVETDPLPQNPVVVGDREAVLAAVEKTALAEYRKKREQEQPGFLPTDMKGMEQQFVAGMDSSIRELYAAFLAAVERGDLMAPPGKSANDHYERLVQVPEMLPLRGQMTRNFAAALIDESQSVTNRLLKTDPQVVSDVWSRPFVFDHIPAHLARATELLGEKHYLYSALKGKACFFEAKTYRPDRYPGIPTDSLLKKVIGKLEEGLHYDPGAAYLHVDIAIVLFWRLFEFERAMEHAKKALEISPNWAYAHVLAGRCYAEGERDLEQGVQHYLRALELDSACLLARQELFWMHKFHGSRATNTYTDRYILEIEKMLATDTAAVPLYHLNWYGLALVLRNRAEEAAVVLEKVEQATRQQDFVCYQFLSQAYWVLRRDDDLIRVYKKLMEINPNNPDPFLGLAGIYLKSGEPEKAVEILKPWEKDSLLPSYFALNVHTLLGEAYMAFGKEEEAKAQFEFVRNDLSVPINALEMNYRGRASLWLDGLPAMEKVIVNGLEKFNGDPFFYYQSACLYSLARQEQKALEWLELALQKDFNDILQIQIDPDLDYIRDSGAFKALLKKYFPDQVKD